MHGVCLFPCALFCIHICFAFYIAYTPPTLNIHVPSIPTLVVLAILIIDEVRDPEMV